MDIDPILIKNFQKIIKMVHYLLNFFSRKKIICNSGYYQNNNHQLKRISKSTATQSTLILDASICTFKKNKKGPEIINKGFKTFNKNVVFEKNQVLRVHTMDIYLGMV